MPADDSPCIKPNLLELSDSFKFLACEMHTKWHGRRGNLNFNFTSSLPLGSCPLSHLQDEVSSTERDSDVAGPKLCRPGDERSSSFDCRAHLSSPRIDMRVFAALCPDPDTEESLVGRLAYGCSCCS